MEARAMTELLEQAIANLKTLPANDQDAIALMILEELQDDMQWNEAFARSRDILAGLAATAMAECHAGKAEELGASNTVKLLTTAQFRKAFADLPEEVREQTRGPYRQLKRNLWHPGLRFKQIHPELPIYSVRITRGCRAVGQQERDVVIWFWIGSHAEYDKLLFQFQRS